jgi:hypothetical protein
MTRIVRKEARPPRHQPTLIEAAMLEWDYPNLF